jgi:hemerythrin-like domain-containing protein
MRKATTDLEDDHVHIIKLTRVMSNMEGKGASDPDHIETVIDTIRNYADRIHHLKEENILFPKLCEKGFSRETGPVAVMLHEHTIGREFAKGMSDKFVLFRGGDKKALHEIFRNMTGYTDLLRNHIEKENNVLFRMADRVLTEREHEELLLHFEEEINSIPTERGPLFYISEIDRLAAIYKVD